MGYQGKQGQFANDNLEPTFKVWYFCVVERSYTIGRLARAADVPTSTVRYYERAKLLRPDGRTGGNYRVYGIAALERLRFIRAAQANGFTLEDISILLSFRDGATARCKQVQALIKDRLADLRKRMLQVHDVEAMVVDLVLLSHIMAVFQPEGQDVWTAEAWEAP